MDWSHVERMRIQFPRLTIDRMEIDAVHPVDDNLRLVLENLA